MPTAAEVKAAFSAFDVNGDGNVSREEFIAILTRPGGGNPMTAAQAADSFAKLDLNGNGVLSYSEFARAWTNSKDMSVAHPTIQMGEGQVWVHLGAAGCRIGAGLWDKLATEGDIGERPDAFYESGQPRAILCDLSGDVIDGLNFAGRSNTVDLKMNFSAGSNWAKGFYSDGRQMINQLMNQTRRLANLGDHLGCINLTHSLGGGTGSGLGSLFLGKLAEEFPDVLVRTWSVAPTTRVSDVVVEPYNALLTYHHLIENASETYERCFENGTRKPTFDDLNGLITSTMAAATYPERRYSANGERRTPATQAQCLAAFRSGQWASRLHFMTLCLPEPAKKVFDFRSIGADVRDGVTAAGVVNLFGGIVNPYDGAPEGPWTPQAGIEAVECDPELKAPKAACLIANSTSVVEVMQRNLDQYQAMFSKRAFLHWYTGEGMEDMDFNEAESNVIDLIAEYGDFIENNNK